MGLGCQLFPKINPLQRIAQYACDTVQFTIAALFGL